MKLKFKIITSLATALAFLLNACGPAQPTLDAAAISTSAAQTVEARFTAEAVVPTQTPLPPTETPAPKSTATKELQPTEAAAAGQSASTTTGKPCYAMTFLSDVTIPDGMIIAPGARFTKTWRVRNDGNCVWDSKYSLVLDKGNAMSTVTSFPLPKVVLPGDSVDISIEMTAPTIEGDYSGYWRILTPYGGTVGVAGYNQSLFVKIKVTPKTGRYFGSVSVVYDWTRRPAKGCTKDGAYYDFSATITANAPGEIEYRWDRNPFDGKIEGGRLKFTEAGSKTVYWTWHMTTDHIQNIDRWVAITTTVASTETTFDRVLFNYTCAP